jgi:hypothetical protein
MTRHHITLKGVTDGGALLCYTRRHHAPAFLPFLQSLAVDFHDTFSWARGTDVLQSGRAPPVWLHGSYLMGPIAAVLVRSFGAVDGSFLVQHLPGRTLENTPVRGLIWCWGFGKSKAGSKTHFMNILQNRASHGIFLYSSERRGHLCPFCASSQDGPRGRKLVFSSILSGVGIPRLTKFIYFADSDYRQERRLPSQAWQRHRVARIGDSACQYIGRFD